MNGKGISSAAEWKHLRSQPESNARLCVLVVDDDDAIRRLNAAALQSSGFAVDTAADGEAAWNALYERDYDLLITDNQMPKVSGIDLLKKVHAVGLALPVIMATGSLPEEEFQQAPWLKPMAVLLKPYTVGDFLETVKDVLRTTKSVRSEILLPPDWLAPAPRQDVRA